MKPIRIICVIALIITIGCTSSVSGKPTRLIQVSDYSTREYKLQPGDQLDIKFFYNPELNEQLTVRSDGRITLQLINDVIAAGLTPSELTTILTKAYSGELSNPRVAVIVRASIADRIFVDGEVNRAGLFNLIGPTTVFQAIAQAGGLKDSAKSNQVLVIRRGNNNNMTYFTVDYGRMINGDGIKEDIFLKPNDIVFIPKSTISNVNTWIDLYLRRNVPLPIGIGYSF